jgi:PII-like signaling protein
MSEPYRLVEIFTSEDVRWQGHPVGKAVIDYVAGLGLAARCVVLRGIAGAYENGEKTTLELEVLSYHLPIKIEILLPAEAIDTVLPGIQERVADGFVLVSDRTLISRRSRHRP